MSNHCSFFMQSLPSYLEQVEKNMEQVEILHICTMRVRVLSFYS